MKALLVAVLWTAMSVPAVQAQTPEEWHDSLSVLNAQIERSPRNTDLRLRKAAINIELDQWKYAEEEYSRVLEIDEKNLAARYYRAYVNTHLRQYDMARYDYELFLSLVPKHFEAQLGLAMVKRLMGRKSEALDELNSLVQLFPDSTLAYVARAGYEAELGYEEPALFDWDEAIRREPKNADYIVSKVELLIQLKRYDEAREELRAAISRGVPSAALKEWIKKCML